MEKNRRDFHAPHPASNPISDSPHLVLEPFTYHQDFESRTLGAWASYPLWQDTAYDPNFRVNEIVPGDPNLSVVQKVTPYTQVDNYAGAQKLFDIYLTPGSEIIFRYFLKTSLPAAFLKVRLAAGPDGKLDLTIPHPPTNRWEWVTVTYGDFLREHPNLAGGDRIKVNALAILTRVPGADPAMPFYFGLDDVTVRAKQVAEFQFSEPEMHKLSEWKPHIPKKHFNQGDTFTLEGRWPLDADRVELSFALFNDPSKALKTVPLHKNGDRWAVDPLVLSFENGLYLNTLRAYRGTRRLSETRFTLHMAPTGIAGKHPRLWFDSDEKREIETRLKNEPFRQVLEDILTRATKEREKVPVESLVYDLDQFPDEDWLPTWAEWGTHIYPTGNAVYWNALAYTFGKDLIAGEYAKQVLLKLADFKDWTHPWPAKRGQFSEHRTGSWCHRIALAYDLAYDLLNEEERTRIRLAFRDKAVRGAHTTYVENNNITSNTSNWIAHIAGGSLMLQAAMFGDGPEVGNMEPVFTGAALKLFEMLWKTVDPEGAWGEGLGYNNYSFQTLSQSLPALKNVFNIDFSGPLNNAYLEYIWAGPVKKKQYFFFGDTGGTLSPIPHWAWLLDRTGDPLLGWFYNFLRYGDDKCATAAHLLKAAPKAEIPREFMDALYETENLPMQDPFGQEPVKCFRNVGTTVFKSGWDPEDFIFVMRTGPFYNHQHLDQGSFWLSFNGSVFIEERQGSTYYDDPLYQPWYTQPVGHSTILINGNHQSQRVGDPLHFAEGFDDWAQVTHFLNGRDAAFVIGDIGRLYWGKVTGLQRKVLFLKPHTVLMLDTAIPNGPDVDVTLLYQTLRLEDISAGTDRSTIKKDGNVLHIEHLFPGHLEVARVETPHYLRTLRNQKPLTKEGMLTVTARTAGIPLVMANLLTATSGQTPHYTAHHGEGFVAGSVGNTPFAFSTNPGKLYQTNGIATDAAAITGKEERLLAAECTRLIRDRCLVIASEKPITCELTGEEIRYYQHDRAQVHLGAREKPPVLFLNGEKVTAFDYDGQRRVIVLRTPPGEHRVRF